MFYDYFPGPCPLKMTGRTAPTVILSDFVTLSNESNNWRQKMNSFFSCVPTVNPFRKKILSTKNAPELFSCGLNRGSFPKKNTDFVIIFSVLEKQDKKQNVQRRIINLSWVSHRRCHCIHLSYFMSLTLQVSRGMPWD